MTAPTKGMLQVNAEEGRPLTLTLCFLAALCEGADIVSMGLAAPKLGPDLGLLPSGLGLALTAAIVGLMIGAAIGGRLSDKLGPKIVLIISIFLLGTFSLVTTLATDLTTLVAYRLLTGLGLGGAFPALIRIVTGLGHRPRAVRLSIMYAGQPLGAVLLASVVAYQGPSSSWREVFYMGGFAPFAILPLLLLLPRDAPGRAAGDRDKTGKLEIASVLFGDGRALLTTLLWLSYALTLAVLYIINSWLPALAVGLGLSKTEAAVVSAVENLGAAVGVLTLGWLLDRLGALRTIVIAYAGMALSLGGLATLSHFAEIATCAALLGFFVVGGQLVLYALTPALYPSAHRGLSVGAAVAVGRVGAIAGPLMVGVALTAGLGSAAAVTIGVPAVVLAGMAAVRLAQMQVT